MNPLDLRGPEFLSFYVAYGLGALAVLLLLRAFLESVVFPGSRPGEFIVGRFPKEQDAYRFALLRGGRNEVIRTVLARLAAADLIEFDDEMVFRSKTEPNPHQLEEMDRRAYHTITSAEELRTVFDRLRSVLEVDIDALEADLKLRGLLRTDAQRFPLWVFLAIALLVVCGMGVAKLVVALERGRTNVGYLALLTGLYAFVTTLVMKPARATSAGRRYLKWLQESHVGLRALVASGRRASAREVALVAAIYGISELSGSLLVMDKLRLALRPRMSTSDTWLTSSSCGSGSSGCGSGGCGGGGCGGGGCGGCGS